MIYFFNTLIVDFNVHIFDIIVPWGKDHIISFLYILGSFVTGKPFLYQPQIIIYLSTHSINIVTSNTHVCIICKHDIQARLWHCRQVINGWRNSIKTLTIHWYSQHTHGIFLKTKAIPKSQLRYQRNAFGNFHTAGILLCLNVLVWCRYRMRRTRDLMIFLARPAWNMVGNKLDI